VQHWKSRSRCNDTPSGAPDLAPDGQECSTDEERKETGRPGTVAEATEGRLKNNRKNLNGEV